MQKPARAVMHALFGFILLGSGAAPALAATVPVYNTPAYQAGILLQGGGSALLEMQINPNALQFAGGGASAGNQPTINFNQGESKIYDNGDLWLQTDDNLYFAADDLITGGILHIQDLGISGNVIQFAGGLGSQPTLSFNRGGSEIKDDGQLRLTTDDYLVLQAPTEVQTQAALRVGSNLTVTSGLSLLGGSLSLPDGSITSKMLADGAVTSGKLASGVSTGGALTDGSVTTAKLANGAVTNAKIADATIALDKLNLAAGSIAGSFIQNNSITSTQLADSIVVQDLTITPSSAANAGEITGLDIGTIANPGANTGSETALAIGSGWDFELEFLDTTPTIALEDGAVLTLEDIDGNDLFKLVDVSTDQSHTFYLDNNTALALDGVNDLDVDLTTGPNETLLIEANGGGSVVINDPLYVGRGTADEQISNTAFTMAIDDLYVEDDLGVDGDLFVDALVNLGVTYIAIADNGAGASAPVQNVTPATSYLEIDCADVDGCTVNLLETNARVGDIVIVSNVRNANDVTIPDANGVVNGTGTPIGAYDTAMFIYTGNAADNTWLQLAGSNN